MTTELPNRPTRSPRAALGRLVAASPVEREALDHYDWPVLLRVAGYVAVGATLLSIAVSDAGYTALPLTLATGIVFLAAFHLTVLARLRDRRRRLALCGVQLLCAAVIQHVSHDDTGPTFLFFVLAAELQVLVPPRAALAITLLLWPLSVELEVTGVSALWSPHSALVLAAATLAGFVFVTAFARSAVAELAQRYGATILLAELNEAHAQLRDAHDQLLVYVSEVEELAVARERNRLARDIHDTIGHYLAIINVQLETAQKLGARDPVAGQEALGAAKRLASECLGEVRRSVAALRPSVLETKPLAEAIDRLASEFRHASGLTVHMSHGAGGERTIPPALEATVYRALQEALTNVQKHAGAHHVWLWTEWGPEVFSAGVRDDGHGVSAGAPDDARAMWEGFGLTSMRDRIEANGGALEASGRADGGFEVTLRIPYPRGTGLPAPLHAGQEALS